MEHFKPETPSGDGEDALLADAEEDPGPRKPSEDVRREVEALLDGDNTRLGEVYRALQRGLTQEAIAAELEVASSNFVWNYNQIIRAMLDGDLPRAPTVVLSVARKFRTILKSSHLSAQLHSYLQANLDELERRADDQSAREAEALRAQEQTEIAEARSETGIYVYALPHYLRYPFDPKSGRTLMKVGRSSDVMLRFRNQTRTTALPEEPILLRIYRTPESAVELASIENDFHRLLKAADHYQSVARTAGREWFITSTKFLDEVARIMHLSIFFVNEAGVPDEG